MALSSDADGSTSTVHDRHRWGLFPRRTWLDALTDAGFEAVDRRVIDAARAQGFTGTQVLWQIEVPLGLPVLVGGLRSAALQVVATATLAAYVGAGGLGRYLFLGLKTQDYAMMLGSSLLVVALALVLDGAFAVAGRVAVPRGVTVARRGVNA